MLTYFIAIAVFVGVLMIIKTFVSKAASKAFEEEFVENEEFTLLKPAGFLTPVDRQFEAYSKDWSEGGNFRKAWVNLKITNGVKQNSKISNKRTEKGVEIETIRKTLANKNLGKTFELEASYVTQYKNEYFDKIQEMLESFKLR
jgi:predicted N-acyltransferase